MLEENKVNSLAAYDLRFAEYNKSTWNKAINVLKQLQDWFAVESRWTCGRSAINVYGHVVTATGTDVAACCFLGAVDRFCRLEPEPYNAIHAAGYAVLEQDILGLGTNNRTCLMNVSDSSWENCKKLVDALLKIAEQEVANRETK